MRKKTWLYFIISFLILLSGCKFAVSSFSTEPIGITIIESQFIIEWDSNESQIPDLPSSIDHYNVFFRKRDSYQWNFLSSTQGDETRITAHLYDFDGYGEYIVAVEGIRMDGHTTGMATSTDFDSSPSGGWYIIMK